jgi:hypothetical protein
VEKAAPTPPDARTSASSSTNLKGEATQRCLLSGPATLAWGLPIPS